LPFDRDVLESNGCEPRPCLVRRDRATGIPQVEQPQGKTGTHVNADEQAVRPERAPYLAEKSLLQRHRRDVVQHRERDNR